MSLPVDQGPPQRRDDVVVRPAGSGAATWAMGSLFERLIGTTETGGALDVSLVTQPPGSASPLHVHTREAEAWYLIEGRLTYRAGDELVQMRAGDFIYLPRNVPHAFRTGGERPAKILAMTVPGSLMDLYDEVGRPAAERRLPGGGVSPDDVARWLQLGPAYGIQVVGPPLTADAARPTSRDGIVP